MAVVCFAVRLKRLQVLHPEGLSSYEQGRLIGGVIGLPLIAFVICAGVPSLRNSRSIGVGLLIAFGFSLMTSLREWLA